MMKVRRKKGPLLGGEEILFLQIIAVARIYIAFSHNTYGCFVHKTRDNAKPKEKFQP